MSTCYDDGSGSSTDGSSGTVPFPWNVPVTSLPSTSTPSSTSGGGIPPWLQSIFVTGANTAKQVAVQTTMPQGYYQQTTPYGQIMSTAGIPQGAGLPQGAGVPGLSMSGMMPILLIGGLALVMMTAGSHR